MLRPRKPMEQLDDYFADLSNPSEDDDHNILPQASPRNTHLNKEDNDRIMAYWKLKHSMPDHALNDLHQIHTSVPSVWSIRNIRRRLNNNIHVKNTEFGSYITMEDATKTLIHINGSIMTKIRRTMTIRLSIDRTQIGEKLKLLVLCISCTQFNSTQQISSKLLPIGLFKIDIKDYETVKKVIPNEIILSIIQESKLIVNGEEFSIKFKLACDYKMLLILFGLNAVSGTYVCPWCKVTTATINQLGSFSAFGRSKGARNMEEAKEEFKNY
ncbi:unnamed protein product [Didymodactylos carnosus]|uniref:Uncharacterized protein n=1 Tax=Didymodactylos carnosus TaxID=1234261 RepID=A0A814T1H3_9BILA|nr:unnamed protein product [Didymodactylos carnosus]CAF3916863.1 unnamed protein product [Didymodactylos carnosus]